MSVYRIQGKREVIAKPWRVSSWDKKVVKMKRFASKIGLALLKTIIFIIGIAVRLWHEFDGLIIVIVLVATLGTLCYYGDKSERKKMENTPCSEFLNQPMEKAPLRCIKEFSK